MCVEVERDQNLAFDVQDARPVGYVVGFGKVVCGWVVWCGGGGEGGGGREEVGVYIRDTP